MHAGTEEQTPKIQREKKKREKTIVPEKGEELDLQIVEVKDFDKFQKQLNSLYTNFNMTTIDFIDETTVLQSSTNITKQSKYLTKTKSN